MRNELAQLLFDRRTELNLSQRAAAGKINRKAASWHYWEGGKQLPPERLLPALAQLLRIEEEVLQGIYRRVKENGLGANPRYSDGWVTAVLDLRHTPLMPDDLEYIQLVQRGLARPMTIGLMLDLLWHRKRGVTASEGSNNDSSNGTPANE